MRKDRDFAAAALLEASGRLEKKQSLADGGDVVDAEDLRPLSGQRHCHADRAWQAVGERRGIWCQIGKESLPRMAHQDGAVQVVQPSDVCE